MLTSRMAILVLVVGAILSPVTSRASDSKVVTLYQALDTLCRSLESDYTGELNLGRSDDSPDTQFYMLIKEPDYRQRWLLRSSMPEEVYQQQLGEKSLSIQMFAILQISVDRQRWLLLSSMTDDELRQVLELDSPLFEYSPKERSTAISQYVNMYTNLLDLHLRQYALTERSPN